MPIQSIKSGSLSRSLAVGNAIILPGDFESIATATGTGSSTTISLSSIPSTFTHLQIRFFARTTTGTSAISTTFNGSGGTNYARHALIGSGASVSAQATVDTSQVYTGYAINTTSTGGVGIIDILDYANTNKYKTLRALTGNDTNTPSNDEVRLTSGLWKNTSAITSITFTSTDNFTTDTKFALYGIRG
jgi:hypothetical protein